MKSGRWALIALVAASFVPGCSKSNPSLVGTWTATSEVRGLPTETEATFAEGGKYRAVTKYLDKDRKKVEMQATDMGTWKYADNVLNIRLDDVEWSWPDAKDDKARQAAEVFRQNKASIIASVNEGGPIQVQWTTPDEIVCTVKQGQYVYTRKKGSPSSTSR